MTEETALPRDRIRRILADLPRLRDYQIFARPEAGAWQEIARQGRIDPDKALAVLQAFDAGQGGQVEALGSDAGSWFASYACRGGGVELCLLLTLQQASPTDLQATLSRVEDRSGWLLLAALEQAGRSVDALMAAGLGRDVLIGAARAQGRHALAEMWVARIETALLPDCVAVVDVWAGLPTLAALSGGGEIATRSAQRAAMEALARHVLTAGRILRLHRDQPQPDPVAEALAVLGVAQVLALPVADRDLTRAVVLLLWNAPNAALPDADSQEALVALLQQSLAIQHRAWPSARRRLRNLAEGLVLGLFGARAWRLKLVVACIALGLGGAAVLPSRHQPEFTARIEARERRIIAAPFDGFLAEAPVALGDQVQPGQLILRLDTSDLVLKQSASRSELARLRGLVQAAQAQRHMAEVLDLSAQIAQTEVELALVEKQIASATATADAPGLVVAGDAWQRVGARLRLGDALVELARPDSIAIRAVVDEDWVADLQPGAAAELTLQAFPDRRIKAVLTRISPAGEVVEGRHGFVAWADLTPGQAVPLTDGMRGVVAIDGGPTTWAGRYGRGLWRAWQRFAGRRF